MNTPINKQVIKKSLFLCRNNGYLPFYGLYDLKADPVQLKFIKSGFPGMLKGLYQIERL
jgi:hypothetical protein